MKFTTEQSRKVRLLCIAYQDDQRPGIFELILNLLKPIINSQVWKLHAGDDGEQDAVVGLYDAVVNFDPTHPPATLYSYFASYIRGAILKGKNKDRTSSTYNPDGEESAYSTFEDIEDLVTILKRMMLEGVIDISDVELLRARHIEQLPLRGILEQYGTRWGSLSTVCVKLNKLNNLLNYYRRKL